MPKHFGVARDLDGNVLSNASVTVELEDTGTLATLYSDETHTTEVANPILTNDNGEYEFFVVDGVYDIHVAKSGYSTYTENDVTIGNLLEPTLYIDDDHTIGDGSDVFERTRIFAALSAAKTLTLPWPDGKKWSKIPFIFVYNWWGSTHNLTVETHDLVTPANIEGAGSSVTSVTVAPGQKYMFIPLTWGSQDPALAAWVLAVLN